MKTRFPGSRCNLRIAYDVFVDAILDSFVPGRAIRPSNGLCKVQAVITISFAVVPIRVAAIRLQPAQGLLLVHIPVHPKHR